MRTGHGNWKGTMLAATAGLVMLGTAVSSAQAAKYYAWQSFGTSHTWTELSMWRSDPGDELTAATTFAGHEFYSNDINVRTNNGNFVFGDSTTQLYLNKALILRTDASNETSTIPNLITYATEGANTPKLTAGHNQHSSVTIGNFINDVTTVIDGDGNSGRFLRMEIENLTGTADLVLNQSIKASLGVEDASGFTGNILWQGGATNASQLTFLNDLVSGGGLIVPETGLIDLNHDVTFTYVKLGDTELEAGITYTFEELNAQFDTIFLDGGTGTITVVPEPASLALMACGGLLALRRRRIV